MSREGQAPADLQGGTGGSSSSHQREGVGRRQYTAKRGGASACQCPEEALRKCWSCLSACLLATAPANIAPPGRCGHPTQGQQHQGLTVTACSWLQAFDLKLVLVAHALGSTWTAGDCSSQSCSSREVWPPYTRATAPGPGCHPMLLAPRF